MAEDEIIGWHHRFNGHEFKEAPGVGDGQGSLLCVACWASCRVFFTVVFPKLKFNHVTFLL